MTTRTLRFLDSNETLTFEIFLKEMQDGLVPDDNPLSDPVREETAKVARQVDLALSRAGIVLEPDHNDVDSALTFEFTTLLALLGRLMENEGYAEKQAQA